MWKHRRVAGLGIAALRAGAVDVNKVIVTGVWRPADLRRGGPPGPGPGPKPPRRSGGPPAMARGDIQPAARPKATYIAAPPPWNPACVVADQ